MADKSDTNLDTTTSGDSSKSPKYVTVETDSSSDATTKTLSNDSSTAPLDNADEVESSKANAATTSEASDSKADTAPGVSNTPSSFSLLDANKQSESSETSTDTTTTGSTSTMPQSTPTITTSDVEDVHPSSTTSKIETTDVNDWLNGDKEDDTAESGGKGKKVAILIIILMVIAGIVAGGVYYYRSNLQKTETSSEIVVSEPTPVPQEEIPTPSVTPEPVELSEISVSVLNGSGIPGEASVVQALLEDAGFTDIDTGNADSYDFLDTGVSVKTGLSRFVYNSIEEALGTDYSIVESDELDEDSTYDVIIIVGFEGPSTDAENEMEAMEESTETPTPTPEE
jgi:hypothetical protein